MVEPLRISRIWEMPARYTFQIPSVAALLRFRGVGCGWIDPFAGISRLAQFRNDLNRENDQPSSLEAAEFVAGFADDSLEGAIFDPPYSVAQVALSYKSVGLTLGGTENPTGGFPKVRDELARVIRPGGVCVSFGWNTCGLGLERGFVLEEVVIVCHGGNHNDTLITIERKDARQPGFI